MNPKRKLTTLVLVLTALSALLAGCGGEQAGTDTTAQQQFLEERKGTPDPSYTPAPGGGLGDRQFITGPGGAGPGMIGTVQSINGRDIIIKDPMSGVESTIHLADDTKITTQVEATLADLKVGDDITAVGKREGDTLTANMVQLGGAASGPMIMNALTGPGGEGPPGAGAGDPIEVPFPQEGDGSQPPSRGMLTDVEMVSGSIDKIEGDTLTVTSPEDKTITVQTTADTRLLKESELDLSALEPGITVMATGEQKDGLFEATALRVAPEMRMMRP